MFQKLELSERPLQNRMKPGKPREVAKVPQVLWTLMAELAEGRRKWPLFLHGGTGTGKTCAALCLADRVKDAQFWEMIDLMATVENVNKGREEYYNLGHGGTWTPQAWWRKFEKMSLVILDDIALRELNDDQVPTLFRALQAREGKPLICTSNLDKKEIQSTYNERICSRLFCGTVHELRGRDRRNSEGESE